MVGRIIIPSKIPAVKTLLPLPPNRFCIMGTMTTNPKKPYTMDGIPARSEIAGFKIRYSFLGQNFAINTEQSSPMGTPTRMAIAVA